MMKKIFIFAAALSAVTSFAQVGINTNNPQASFHVDGGKDNVITGSPTAVQQSNDVVVTQTGNVGIGTIAPNNSSLLDLTSSNKGLLLPRIALTGTTDAISVPNPATGLLIYNTATVGAAPYEVTPNIMINTGTPVSPMWTKVVSQNTVTGTGVIGTWTGPNSSSAFTGWITSIEDGISFRSSLAQSDFYCDYAMVTAGTNVVSTAGSEEGSNGWYWKGKDSSTVGTSMTQITSPSGVGMGSGRRTITVTNLTTGFIYRITLMIDSSNNRAFYFVEKVK